jgi:hypothetical protein
MLTLGLAVILAVTARAVTIRHDVADQRYRELARRPELAAGLVVTRPDAPVPGGGVLLHPRCVLTAGHVGSVEGPADMPVAYQGKRYIVDHVYLYPGFKQARETFGGHDLAILRLKGAGLTGVPPAVVWRGGLRPGQRFIGVGQGKTGTGRQNDEPDAARTFRGYENTIDHVFGSERHGLLVADFDSPEGQGNTLAHTLFYPTRTPIRGRSSATPLPLEGAATAGDSGSGIWGLIGGKHRLIGITTFRIYSGYGGQSYYVNLSDPRLADWIARTCAGSAVLAR